MVQHNIFIDTELAKKLGLLVEVIPTLSVTVADGTTKLIDIACKDLPYSIQGHKFVFELRLYP